MTLPEISQFAGLITATFVVVSGLVGGIVWFSNLHSKLTETTKSTDDLKKDIVALDVRMVAMEDHKISVAVLGTQMGMVLDKIAELSRDVKNLLDGHARLASRDHGEVQ
ncbi:hypothetical protein UFOVP28_41 [uncultured Caudovirales phage]|uniref:Uncharacterized protein n=1 Tax=uncultured Caudovirales phage TaxID=2100421 RepID=A0A6J5KKK2_9CAUD|nr:hypothetical protein UFOVP28_41 [uncultured Caudovirales phage]